MDLVYFQFLSIIMIIVFFSLLGFKVKVWEQHYRLNKKNPKRTSLEETLAQIQVLLEHFSNTQNQKRENKEGQA